jgi:phosphoribosylanthranilate isomerase
MRTRVKICGITREEDALAAVAAGADAIGLVFYPPSPRSVTLEQAEAITRHLPPFVTVVGLFVNAEAETIRESTRAGRVSLIQFHGQECPAYCAQHGLPWLKAIRMKDDLDLDKAAADYAGASALLLDAYRPGVPGGTGETFDWARIPSHLGERIVLAGGLNPDNVAEAVRQVRPYAVDVSGGVEAEKGIKDSARIAAFMRGVRVGQD